MQRYFIEQSKQEVTAAPAFSIKGEDVHHIATVMRMSPGDEVICCAKDGHEAKCRIESVTKEEVLLSVIEWTGETRELPVQIHIANGLPKGDKLEWIIQKRDRARCKLVYSFSGIALRC
ncbi:RsmE family RNA methyltransferase [Bacillus licheniformis]